ncbi:active regulator of SIRT1-like [Chelonus insularis]|uniref:active regulator of SIRT1-like n=1 Tax=Chelonus insularis TaxID=460826 RepID=UPI00158A1AE8|nr:active regulator of SIRT1-like [Chelonus insularis]
MSNSLVRASLDLISLENDVKEEKKKKKNRSKDILHLIPSNHRNIKKNKKADSSIGFQHSRKITVYEAKKQLAKKTDPTNDNVHKLLLLGGNKIDSNAAKKFFERGIKKRAVIEEDKLEEEEKTVFTEEDFQNFEKEYFGASK